MKLIFVFTFFFLLSATANGGEIQGRVLNAQGAAISEAKVTVTNQRAGAIWQAVTEEDGFYSHSGSRIWILHGEGSLRLPNRECCSGRFPSGKRSA